MAIADVLLKVEREFVPGFVLFEAVARQEKLTDVQTASWFMRNIEALNKLQMLSYNASLNNFHNIKDPWAGDIFGEIAYKGETDINWDEDGNGYVGGWLSSDLKEFFTESECTYPQLHIEQLCASPSPQSSKPSQFITPAVSIDAFLQKRSADFIEAKKWVEWLGADLLRVGIALRMAFTETKGFPPLYHIDSSIDAKVLIPIRLTADDAAAAWSDLLVSFAVEMMPDLFFGNSDEADRWVSNLFVRQADCNFFARSSGLPLIQGIDSTNGEMEFAIINLEASQEKDRGQPNAQTEMRPKAEPEKYPTAPEKALLTRERNTLLKLVIGMAIKGYKYDPLALKSPSSTEIASDLAELGISVTDETVLKYLREATKAVLPGGVP